MAMGTLDWQVRQIIQETALTRNKLPDDMHQAARQQEHQRGDRRQGNTRGRTSVVPEAPMPGGQGTRSPPRAEEDAHDEARRLEPKEKCGGRLQRLMGKPTWWSSRKND